MEIVRSKCARFCEILKYISTSPIISSYHPGSEKNIKRSCRVKPLCRPLHGKTIHLSMQTIFSSWQLTTQALRLLEKSCSEKKKHLSRGHNCHVRVGDAGAAKGFQTPELHGAICASTERLESIAEFQNVSCKYIHDLTCSQCSLQKVLNSGLPIFGETF